MSCSRDPNLDPEDDIHIVDSDDDDLEFVEELEGEEDFEIGGEDERVSLDNDGQSNMLVVVADKLTRV